MRKKPRLLGYIAAALIAMALSFPVQIMVLYEHAPWEWSAIAAKLAPLNWVVMALAPLAAWSVYHASPWVLLTVPVLAAAVALNNWFVAELATDYSPFSVGLGTGSFLLAMTSLMTASIRQFFLNPEKRWWLTPARRRAALPIRLRLNLEEVEAITYDVSEGGAFIKSTAIDDAASDPISKFPIGTRLIVALSLSKHPSIRCRAEIVRTVQKQNGSYPAGVGLKFLDLGWKERRALHRYAGNAGPSASLEQKAA